MHNISTVRSFAVLVCATLAVSFLLFYDFGKSYSRIIDSLINLDHLPLFGMIALVLFWFLTQVSAVNENYLKSWIITCLIGVLTEGIQLLIPYRYFRFRDIYTDALGAALFLSLLYIIRNGFRDNMQY